MKIEKYRNLMSKIDTDISCDDKIKNELRLCESYKADDHKMYLLSKGISNGKKFSIATAFSKVTLVSRVLPSVACLAVITIIFLSFLMHLQTTVPANNGLVTGIDINSSTTNITTEETSEYSKDEVDVEQENSFTATDHEVNMYEKLSTDELAEVGNFYYASFDVVANSKVKTSIPNLVVRFHGYINSINPEDFTDIVLTRDGVPIDNGIKLTNKIKQYVWGYEEITDFYFEFTSNNTIPGVYGLTGKYKGVPFEVYNKIIEEGVTDEAANPDDLDQVSFVGSWDEKDNWIEISEIVFSFDGLQNSFYLSDLTDLMITCNGKEVPFSIRDDVFRFREINQDNLADTFYNLKLTKGITDPGIYIVSGKYKGVPFVSRELVIP